MSYCEWCGYDGAPHPKCDEKMKRRERIDSELLPMLSTLGVNAYLDNLKHQIAKLIEAQMDKGVEEGHSVDPVDRCDDCGAPAHAGPCEHEV